MQIIEINDTSNVIDIGMQGENGYRKIVYTYSPEWAGGSITPFMRPPGDNTSYPIEGAEQDQDGCTISFMITHRETSRAGRGTLEFLFESGSKVAKSKTFATVVDGSIIMEG